MSDKWTDDRERAWRARDDRDENPRGDSYGRAGQDRSWERDRPDMYAARRDGPDRDRVFGERETGASYGRGPAGGYEGRNPQRYGGRFGGQDYTQDSRSYGDAGRPYATRDDYDISRYSPTRARYHTSGFGDPGFDDEPPARRGGDVYEDRRDESWEAVGRDAGHFLHRAGERVASWFGGDRDAPHHESLADRGHRGRGPQGYQRSDERINEDVHERLTDDRWLDASDVSVIVTSGEVVLSGVVENRDAKHRAEHIVEDIPGVKHVQNNLRARQSAGNVGTSELSPDEPALQESVLGSQIRVEGPSDLGEMLGRKTTN